MTDELCVDLSGAPQTMLATLYAKALDAESPRSLLHDTWARDIVARLDYDWARTTITPRTAPAVSTRAAHFDTWVRQFLALHPRATVLHLGCGLDSRYFRIAPGPDVEWYDVDFPDVAALRVRLYPTAEHCHVVAASVTDPGYLADIPADRPTLILGEGLTMYLTRDDGIALLRRVVDRFPLGELQFDAFNRFGIRTQWTNAVVRRAGATLYWGIDGPAEILAAVPGTRLLAWLSVFESDSFRGIPGPYRAMGKAMSVLPALRYMAQYHRYAFGRPG
ncbi:class I SAM-dependent methyltransferase [Mycolicibacterium arenosum]|uniref:Class I SAM-dependent methyltransferase n=1 Tax=Mycolicibacterium arenosum TaxID=2952157 RepID=A0ABT1M9C4_9MYCO|nr:class I SAM-dependent methyltransferase [Mycolicibacterium sp. CAU 1645]MCP9275751.1 class I SAM-dependent methyltransferase [Mycolicibacterium sp. CAU 1645]